MTEAFGSLVLPFPLNPKLRGRSSVARSIISTWEGPGVQVVADVPALGPVPPPYSVVMPLAMASSHCWGQMNWVWVSTPPGGDDEFLSGDDVGGRSHDHLPPRIERHAVHEVGIARLADVVDAISLDPGVGLDDPQHCIKDDGVGDDAIEGEGGGDGGH
mmetsp:Transcript_4870/g.10010  ORF Transcript_4870/g.10010 Transcript_4870/m.10010 type:complete len:159 (-) Transcript_4870:457-933(-)